MATAFDLTSYPLDAQTRFAVTLGVQRDEMSDGSLRIRQTGPQGIAASLVFGTMDASKGESFEAYIQSKRTTELTITQRGTTYSGYLWGPLEAEELGAGLVRYSINFRGIVV